MYGALNGFFDPVVAFACTNAHVSDAAAFHDCPYVCEVHIDESVLGDQIGDALNALSENVVSHRERLEHGCVLVACIDELVIRDDYE